MVDISFYNVKNSKLVTFHGKDFYTCMIPPYMNRTLTPKRTRPAKEIDSISMGAIIKYASHTIFQTPDLRRREEIACWSKMGKTNQNYTLH